MLIGRAGTSSHIYHKQPFQVSIIFGIYMHNHTDAEVILFIYRAWYFQSMKMYVLYILLIYIYIFVELHKSGAFLTCQQHDTARYKLHVEHYLWLH